MGCKDCALRECEGCYGQIVCDIDGDYHDPDYKCDDYEAEEILPPYEREGDIICGNGCEIVGYIRQTDGGIEWLADKCPHCGMKVEKDKVERTT